MACKSLQMVASKQLPLPQVIQPDAVTDEAAEDPTDLENEIENETTDADSVAVFNFTKEATGARQHLPPQRWQAQ